MTFVVSDAQFGSAFTIDKIQTWSTPDDHSGVVGTNLNITIPAAPALPSLATGTGSLANPYGKRGLPTVTWSLDKISWYPNGGQLIYFNGTFAEYITQLSAYVTCSDSLITFVVTTGYTAPQTVYFQLAVDNPT